MIWKERCEMYEEKSVSLKLYYLYNINFGTLCFFLSNLLLATSITSNLDPISEKEDLQKSHASFLYMIYL